MGDKKMKRNRLKTYILIFVIGISFAIPFFMNIGTANATITTIILEWTTFNCKDSRDSDPSGRFYIEIKYNKDGDYNRVITSKKLCQEELETDIGITETLDKCTLGTKMYIRCFEWDFLSSDDMVISINDADHGRTETNDYWAEINVPAVMQTGYEYFYKIYSDSGYPYSQEYIIFKLYLD